MKASNFPASLLRIGTWELARQPRFFRETIPQPRKHTLWQATSDFTEGQATIHRRHFLNRPQNVLSKQFEKLIQCDPRLCALSSEPDIILQNLFFEPRSSFFEDSEEFKCHPFDKLKDTYGHAIQDSSVSCANDIRDSVATLSAVSMGNIRAQGPEIKSGFIKGVNAVGSEVTNNQNSWNQLKLSEFKPSMSVSDFVSKLEQCISEQISSGNPHLLGATVRDKVMLEELVQCLFSDSQVLASDEKSIMLKVNSFCSLLQKDDSTAQSQQMEGASTLAVANDSSENTQVKEDTT